MKLTRVTITGADDAVDPAELISVSQQFPFVEWGLLCSLKRDGEPRYPSKQWRHRLASDCERAGVFLKCSDHLCGDLARRAITDQPGLLSGTTLSRRVQVNGFGRRGFDWETQDVIVYGVAPGGGAEQLLALTPLVPPTYPGVYALLDERGYVKIGKADNIARRLRQLQGASPKPLALVAVLSRDKRLEPTLHRRLKNHGWVRGEWFAPTARVIDEIRAARGRF